MSSLKILVVLFNKQLQDSETLTSLRDTPVFFEKCEIIIWNNGLKHIEREELETFLPTKTYYIHTPENTPLSKIYNTVIKDYIELPDYLLLLDDDTKLKKSFFEELYNIISVENKVADVYLPRILNNGILVSPAQMIYFKGKYYKKLNSGFNKSKFIVAINSGMTISGDYLINKFEGYDEKMKFYGTDTYFMKKLVQNKGLVYVLESSLSHDLSFFSENVSSKSKIKKLNDMIYGLQILISKEEWYVRWALSLYVFMLRLKYFLKFKTLK